MKILAVDYGESRTGLAICDATEMLTRAITPQIEEKSMNKVAEAVVEAAKANDYEVIIIADHGNVVGLCKNMDGTEGSQAKKCRRIAGKIAELWGSEPVMWDERQTTISAAAILSETNTFGKKRKEILDSVSAAVILEAYLAWRKNHPGQDEP